MANKWRTMLGKKKSPKMVVLDKDFAGIKAGSKLFVATPQIIDDYIRRIPEGQTRTIERLRNELAEKISAQPLAQSRRLFLFGYRLSLHWRNWPRARPCIR
jgi:hypothetical protein